MLLRGSSEDANSVYVDSKSLVPSLLTKFCQVNTVMYCVHYMRLLLLVCIKSLLYF